jgi:hypothetical protein
MIGKLLSFDFILAIVIIVLIMKTNFKHKKVIFYLWCLLYINSIVLYLRIILWFTMLKLGYDRDIETKKLCNFIIKQNNLKIIDNFDTKLPKIKTIFVVNYPHCELEYLIMRMLPIDVCGVATDSTVGNLMKLSGNEDKFIMIKLHKQSNYNLLKQEIKEKIKTMSIWAYAENILKRYDPSRIALPIRTGLFAISNELNIPITPVYVSRIQHNCGRIVGNFIVIKLGETHVVKNIKETKNYVTKFFQENHKKYY